MSLSDRQPASRSAAHGPLGQGQPAERRMGSPKGIGQAGFEWQRTEGKLNEIGLNVSMDGQLKDGLVKNACFLEPSKLCFFEGKRDKELSVEVQDREHQAGSGHLDSRYVISDSCHSSEGNLVPQKTSGFQLGPREGPDQNKATTVPGMVAGKNGPETKSQPDPAVPGAADLPAREQGASAWNPNFPAVAPGRQGSAAASPGKENGIAPGCRLTGVGGDSSGQLECGSPLPVAVTPPAPATEHSPTAIPPITMVEFTQENSNAGSHVGDQKDMGKLSPPEEGALPDQAPQQKKAMRRALSECSHLSVPPAVNLAEKYPEPPARGEPASGLLSLPSDPAPPPAPRKPGPPVRRSMTVAEEQMAGHTLQPGELPTLSTEGMPPSLREEPAAKETEEPTPLGSIGSGKKERGPAGLPLHGQLERIPEAGSKEQGREDGSEATADSGRQLCQGGEGQPGQAALARKKEIEVTASQSSPSFIKTEVSKASRGGDTRC